MHNPLNKSNELITDPSLVVQFIRTDMTLRVKHQLSISTVQFDAG